MTVVPIYEKKIIPKTVYCVRAGVWGGVPPPRGGAGAQPPRNGGAYLRKKKVRSVRLPDQDCLQALRSAEDCPQAGRLRRMSAPEPKFKRQLGNTKRLSAPRSRLEAKAWDRIFGDS